MKLFLLISLFTTPLLCAEARELKDPMQPPAFAMIKFQQQKNKGVKKTTVVVKKPEFKTLQLTSILFSRARRIAIIDDQLLKVGDTVSGAKLVKIEKHSARLIRKGKVINLTLTDRQSVIKKTAAEKKL